MKTRTNVEMLLALKQYNKVAREVKAKKEGFASSEEFTVYLKGQISLGFGNETYLKVTPTLNAPVKGKKATIKTKVLKERVTIHVIDILDSSGSMSGGKIRAAIQGINLGINQLKEDKKNIKYTYSLCDFSDTVIFRHEVASLNKVGLLKGNTRGATALYDAIGDSIYLVKPYVKENQKVLVNIYTDGQENASRRFNSAKIASMIEEFSKIGWTFTFIGTENDVAFAQKNLKFDISNTLVHDNTQRGLEKAFATNNLSRSMYASKVEAGEDVSVGFYKNIK